MNKNKVYSITSDFISENKLFKYPLNLFKICKMYDWKVAYNNLKDLLEIF